MVYAADPTQMIILPINKDAQIDVPSTKQGQLWLQVLRVLEHWPGFQRLYWGRHVEEPGQVHLHIVRSSLHQHYALLAAPQWQEITRTLISLGISDASSLTVRHAMISRFSPNPKSVGNGAPVTGTAIYLASDPAAWEKTWALWTGIVANVPGCMGVTGGWMVEPVDGYSPFVVYVGWESLKVHDAYHHTKHFRRRAVILGQNNHGYREYGHVAFGNSRAREANL